MTAPDTLQSWKALEAHAQHTPDITPDFAAMSIAIEGMLFDYSKHCANAETLRLLCALARECNVEAKRDAMLRGEHINSTEDRAVLHTALRASPALPEVEATLQRMEAFAHTLEGITDIVNIGIGGSSLGPELATKALAGFHAPGRRAHYVSNVEASQLHHVLQAVKPEYTLFIIASKTFTTAETMQNAEIAKAWFTRTAPHLKTQDHFAAVSTNIAAAQEFGIAEQNIFPMWDWVGGRYSVWSAIGLSTLLMVGANNFRQLLAGARAMDEHFKTAPLEKNIPVISALLGVWYRNFLEYPAYAVIPYHAALGRLPAWLQQLDMESNGKSVDHQGRRVHYATGPIIFGEPGTDSQHSFFQWLHQSPTPIPVDFIVAAKPCCGTPAQQQMLLANCLAQSEALMAGKTNTAEPHRNFEGNRPSTTIVLDALTPYTLGLLLAFYEHKVFVQGAVWNINSFDQWGVELGKVLAKDIQQKLAGGQKHPGLLGYVQSKQT